MKQTYNSPLVCLEVVDNLLRVFLPQEDISTVTAAHDKLTLWAVEVDTFYWKRPRESHSAAYKALM